MKRLTESQCIQAIQEYLQECDCDELARLTGELFGGECYYLFDEANFTSYSFEPNEYYSGQFDNIKDN